MPKQLDKKPDPWPTALPDRLAALEAALRSGAARTQLRAIDASWPFKADAAPLVPALAALLTSDQYVPCTALEYDFSGHSLIAFEAMRAIESIGIAPDLETLRAILADHRVHTLPEACYDQGAYIGDYASQLVAPAGLAARLVRVAGVSAFRLAPQLAVNAQRAEAEREIADPALRALADLAALAPQASPNLRAMLAGAVDAVAANPQAKHPTTAHGFAMRDCVAVCRKRLTSSI